MIAAKYVEVLDYSGPAGCEWSASSYQKAGLYLCPNQPCLMWYSGAGLPVSTTIAVGAVRTDAPSSVVSADHLLRAIALVRAPAQDVAKIIGGQP